MNDKLIKLALDAHLLNYVDNETPRRYFICGNADLEEVEKFAELIVMECVNAVMDGTPEGDYYAMRIEKHFDNGTGGVLHFGVEE